MTEGFKIKVGSGELKTHLSGRASYHRKRADEKERELPGLREAMDRLKAQRNVMPENLAAMTKGSNVSNYHLDPDDPVKSLETDIREHRNKAMVFDFFAGHLFDGDYVLQENDLIRLEILKR